jgi:S1-C subfamily serine protease
VTTDSWDTLRLPAPPGDDASGGDVDLDRDAPPPIFPPIPERRTAARPPAEAGPDRRPRVAVVAVLAALLGAILGSGAAVLAIDSRTPAEETPVAAPDSEGDSEGAQAPVIELNGSEDVDRVAAVAAAVLPSVVQIDIEGDGGLLGPAAGNGSGVIYRSDGHILTNNHVISGADTMVVVLADGTRLDAEVVGTDALNDLAVVRVDRDDLPAIQIGDSSNLRVGELAVAIGSPFGLEGSVTAGVVSALGRSVPVRGPDGSGLLPNVIQTDAPINPGNSGGALVGGDARLIGINSAILTTGATPANAGVGFATPVNTAVDIADKLIEDGFVQHPFLGVAGRDVTPEVADRVGVERGAYIESVEPGTPAADAGLRADDVIVEVEGEAVRSMEELIVAIRNSEVGASVSLTYIRAGEERTVEVTLIERPR